MQSKLHTQTSLSLCVNTAFIPSMLLIQGLFIISTISAHEKRFAKTMKLRNDRKKDEAPAELKQIPHHFGD